MQHSIDLTMIRYYHKMYYLSSKIGSYFEC